ncbi:ExbD/TolR family protein, partial [Chlamydiota bacterium]
LSSTFIMQPSIKINLPEAAHSDNQKEEEFSVIIKKDGLIFFNEYEITLEKLRDRLHSISIRDPKKVLIIKADKDVRHGKVIEVIGVAKEIGISHFAIATKPNVTENSEE